MQDDLLTLAKFLEQYAKEVSSLSSEASKAYSIELLKALVNFTPVDTSQLVSNWVITINNKALSTLPPHHKGKLGSTKEISGLKTITDALNIIKTIKPGDKVYISNLAPQIIYTNYGTTKQEPKYFIEKAMQLAEKNVNLDKLQIKLDAKR